MVMITRVDLIIVTYGTYTHKLHSVCRKQSD